MADLRVSDQERERTAQQLREHFVAGRLDDDELNDRVQQAYSARTAAQLQRLVADLPQLPASPKEQKAALAARRRQLQRRMIQEAGGGITLFVICLAIWISDGAQGQFWPIWVAIIVLIPLVRNTWRLYGPSPEFDRVERELEARSRRAQDHRHRHRRR